MVNRQNNPTAAGATLIVEVYRVIEYRPAPKSCGAKVKFASEDDAIAAAERHNRRFVCGDMQPYWCRRHWAWHIGHDNRRRIRLKIARLEADSAWFAQWAARTRGNAA